MPWAWELAFLHTVSPGEVLRETGVCEAAFLIMTPSGTPARSWPSVGSQSFGLQAQLSNDRNRNPKPRAGVSDAWCWALCAAGRPSAPCFPLGLFCKSCFTLIKDSFPEMVTKPWITQWCLRITKEIQTFRILFTANWGLRRRNAFRHTPSPVRALGRSDQRDPPPSDF